MKKSITFLLALCLSIPLFACGSNETANAAKNVLAQKADELILAIGDVSIEKEISIMVAKSYIDTLTNEQKEQVENIAILESALSDLAIAKKEAEYERIYDEAVTLEDNCAFQAASEKFATLPAEYEDVALRHSVTSLLSKLSGTWTCDDRYAESNKGVKVVTWAQQIVLTPKEGGQYQENPVDGKNVRFQCNHSMHAYNNGDTAIIDSSSAQILKDIPAFAHIVLQEDGNYVISATSKFEGYNNCTVTHTLRADGKLEVRFEYSQYNSKNDVTAATFIYSKIN